MFFYLVLHLEVENKVNNLQYNEAVLPECSYSTQ